MNKALSIIAVILSVSALVTAVVIKGYRPAPQTVDLSSENDDLKNQVEVLQQKISSLEESHQVLRNQLADMRNPSSTSPVSTDEPLANKVNDLALKQSELEELTRDIDKYGIIQSKEKELVKAYNTLMDESLPMWTRAKQAEELKRYGQFDEEAVAAMKNAWNDAEDNNQRAGILHALKDYVDDGMRDQILLSLAEEFENGAPSDKFRHVAIDALEPMRSQPEVSQWLEYIAQNDPQSKIAGHAMRTLQPSVQNTSQPSK